MYEMLIADLKTEPSRKSTPTTPSGNTLPQIGDIHVRYGSITNRSIIPQSGLHVLLTLAAKTPVLVHRMKL